ncbi:MAG: ABC transporter ATP-binding protein [Candidatus Thiodiazotropha sp. 6PLUC2]
MNTSNRYLIIEDLYKRYGNKLVLDNIDLSVDQGELCTLVGPSGCGKSTLLRILVGEEQQSEGRVLLDGESISTPDEKRGIVFQRYSLFPHLSVLDNVTLGLRLGGRAGSDKLSNKQIEEEARSYLKRVRLEAHGHKYPHELSGGMQQRVAIAQSLIMKPKLLLMDEPFGALDPDTREDLQLFLIELWEEQQMTIFFITHDLEEAAFLGTRLLVLSQYYRDDRGDGQEINRGSKVVADHALPRYMSSTAVKHSTEFGDLIQQVREEGFNPEYLQHAKAFNLTHPNAYQTLTEEELRESNERSKKQ